MQIAISLLLAAMSLLTQVANTPNVSPDFRLMAENIATQAVSIANQAIANEQTVISTTTPPILTESLFIPPVVAPIQAVFGSIPVQPVVDKQLNCTLTSGRIGEVGGYVEWTSTNATSGHLEIVLPSNAGKKNPIVDEDFNALGNRYDFGVLSTSSVSSGYDHSFLIGDSGDTTFRATFNGSGGQVVCNSTVI